MQIHDRSRGELPPAENYQADLTEPETVGWPETIGIGVFLLLWMVAVIVA